MSRDWLDYNERRVADLTAERDAAERKLLEVADDNVRLRAALEEMLIIKPRDEAETAFHRIALRALEGE